ncbi:unnamed protein product [Polarella glacialis]|uniref:Uncharacterized protein n=1 Tax=Polarella glacialis TaxID=89957 RepID=A0A813HYI0_POLGL|nr:unnamed protein product [Polarella glacialis]
MSMPEEGPIMTRLKLIPTTMQRVADPNDVAIPALFCLTTFALSLFGLLFLAQLFVLDMVIPNPYAVHFVEKPDVRDLLLDMTQDVIPPLQHYIREATASTIQEPLLAQLATPDQQQGCIRRWAEKVRGESNMSRTDPDQIRIVLDRMGLGTMKHARRIMAPWLAAPVDVGPLLAQVEGCLAENPLVTEFACRTEADASLAFGIGDDPARFQATLRGILHFVVVLEQVVAEGSSDSIFYHEVVERLVQGDASQLRTIDGFDMTLEQKLQLDSGMPIHIAEAAWEDLNHGHVENVNVALALMTLEGVHEFQVMSKEWAHACLGWSMASVSMGANPELLAAFAKLAIPSVSCMGHGPYADSFVKNHRLSLLLSLIYVNRPEFPGKVTWEMRSPELTRAWGHANFDSMPISMPQRGQIEEKLNQMCAGRCQHGSAVFGHFGFSDFRKLNAIVAWATVLLLGLGMEVLLGSHIFQHLPEHHVEAFWKYSQFAFPLLTMVSFNAAARQSWFALFPLVLGMWKFGYPETICSLLSALKSYRLGHRTTALRRLCDGVGLLLHHGSASLVVCALITGVVPQTRELQSCILPLVLQHWFALLRYWSVGLYTFIELALEVVFELEVLGNYAAFFNLDMIMRMASSGMLFAHWLFLSSGMLGLISGFCEPRQGPEEAPEEADEIPAHNRARRRSQSLNDMNAAVDKLMGKQPNLREELAGVLPGVLPGDDAHMGERPRRVGWGLV